MWRNGLLCHTGVAMVAWPKSVASTIRPPCHVNEYARRSGCSPAMDKNPRAIGTPAATNRPQNPSNSGSAATSLVPASMSQACKGVWPAPGSEDTELGVLMELEVGHGETEVHAG